MMKKTIRVEEIRDMLNSQLGNQAICKNDKATICCILEEILHRTGNYRGFGWNLPADKAKSVTYSDDTYYNRIYF